MNEKKIAAQYERATLTKTNVKFCFNYGEEIPLKAIFRSKCRIKLQNEFYVPSPELIILKDFEK